MKRLILGVLTGMLFFTTTCFADASEESDAYPGQRIFDRASYVAPGNFTPLQYPSGGKSFFSSLGDEVKQPSFLYSGAGMVGLGIAGAILGGPAGFVVGGILGSLLGNEAGKNDSKETSFGMGGLIGGVILGASGGLLGAVALGFLGLSLGKMIGRSAE